MPGWGTQPWSGYGRKAPVDPCDAFSRLLLAGAASLALGCVPDTTLDQPAGGARPSDQRALRVTLPQESTGEVPVNLAALRVALAEDASATGPGAEDPLAPTLGGALRLVIVAPRTEVALGPLIRVPCWVGEGARCFLVPLQAPLDPGSRFEVSLSQDVPLAPGRTAKAGRLGSWATASARDDTAPVLVDVRAEISDCVRVAWTTDESAAATVARAGTPPVPEFELAPDAAPVVAFRPAAPVRPKELQLTLRDLAGNLSVSATLPIQLSTTWPPLTITEVLGNPAGAEATQEWVELANDADAPVSLDGFALEVGANRETLPTGVVIPPAGRALIVGHDFRVSDAADPPPSSETTLVRLAGRLGGDGITNGGESVRLRSSDGLIVSAYGGWIDASASRWNGRSVQRRHGAPCDAASAWDLQPAVPTPGW